MGLRRAGDFMAFAAHESFQLSTDRLNEEPALLEVLKGKDGQEVSVSDGCRTVGSLTQKAVELPAVEVGKEKH